MDFSLSSVAPAVSRLAAQHRTKRRACETSAMRGRGRLI
jgi:hypothetical protein